MINKFAVVLNESSDKWTWGHALSIARQNTEERHLFVVNEQCTTESNHEYDNTGLREWKKSKVQKIMHKKQIRAS
jgi:hypothetical protein